MSTESKDPLAQLRDQIDAVDRRLLELMTERAELARRVGEAKRRESGDGEPEFYRAEREAQVLRRMRELNPGPMKDETIAAVFREIMSGCLALSKVLTIAYLGPAGTFTEEAAVKHFGHAARVMPRGTISDVFAGVESGEAEYGVAPVENSTEGMVSHTLDSFLDSPLHICGEVILPVRLHLMVREGTPHEHVQWICAHEQALAQCRNWLERNWKGVGQQAASSNGEAARRAAETAGMAALAGASAAEHYGLQVLERNVQDLGDNTTRFLVIGREKVRPSGRDKSSIIASVKNRPGALYELLEPFRDAGIQLTRLESRPSRGETWTYVFFIEFEGHEDEEKIAGVLEQLQQSTVILKRLGSYPRAPLDEGSGPA